MTMGSHHNSIHYGGGRSIRASKTGTTLAVLKQAPTGRMIFVSGLLASPPWPLVVWLGIVRRKFGGIFAYCVTI